MKAKRYPSKRRLVEIHICENCDETLESEVERLRAALEGEK